MTYSPSAGLQVDVEKVAAERYVDTCNHVDRTAAVKGVRTLTTGSNIYSYGMDRILVSVEHARMLMHSRANYGDLTHGYIKDLVGHSVSMSSAALLTIAMLLASKIPGLWELEPASDSF